MCSCVFVFVYIVLVGRVAFMQGRGAALTIALVIAVPPVGPAHVSGISLNGLQLGMGKWGWESYFFKIAVPRLLHTRGGYPGTVEDVGGHALEHFLLWKFLGKFPGIVSSTNFRTNTNGLILTLLPCGLIDLPRSVQSV